MELNVGKEIAALKRMTVEHNQVPCHFLRQAARLGLYFSGLQGR